MQRVASIAVAILFVLPHLALAQEDLPSQLGGPLEEKTARSFVINHFSFNPSKKEFIFRGKVNGLPDETTLSGNLYLEGNLGASESFFVKEGVFQGEFEVGERKVYPGVYVLELVADKGQQRGSVRDGFPAGLDFDSAVRHVSHQRSSAARETEKVREQIAEEVIGTMAA